MVELREWCLRAFEHGRKEEALRLLSKVEQPEPVLVHWSAYRGWPDVCRQLVEIYKLSPSDEAGLLGGGFMRRPLHWACECCQVEVVKYLLTLPTVKHTVNECGGDGLSALELACGNLHMSVIEVLVSEPSVHMPNHLDRNNLDILSLLSRIRTSETTEYPITAYFPVFMAGNTTAGKTTLTKALLQLTQQSRSRHGGDMVTGVKTLTAGICPSQCSG